jgi:hypothetical protein
VFDYSFIDLPRGLHAGGGGISRGSKPVLKKSISTEQLFVITTGVVRLVKKPF